MERHMVVTKKEVTTKKLLSLTLFIFNDELIKHQLTCEAGAVPDVQLISGRVQIIVLHSPDEQGWRCVEAGVREHARRPRGPNNLPVVEFQGHGPSAQQNLNLSQKGDVTMVVTSWRRKGNVINKNTGSEFWRRCSSRSRTTYSPQCDFAFWAADHIRGFFMAQIHRNNGESLIWNKKPKPLQD